MFVSSATLLNERENKWASHACPPRITSSITPILCIESDVRSGYTEIRAVFLLDASGVRRAWCQSYAVENYIIYLNRDSLIRTDIYRINGFDIDFISNNHPLYCLHRTPSEQQNQMESIWCACMRQIVQIILLLYWFIEMALIFERNANLQFSTFDRFQKIKCMIYSTCKSTDSDTGWSACVYLFFVVIYFPR